MMLIAIYANRKRTYVYLGITFVRNIRRIGFIDSSNEKGKKRNKIIPFPRTITTSVVVVVIGARSTNQLKWHNQAWILA